MDPAKEKMREVAKRVAELVRKLPWRRIAERVAGLIERSPEAIARIARRLRRRIAAIGEEALRRKYIGRLDTVLEALLEGRITAEEAKMALQIIEKQLELEARP